MAEAAEEGHDFVLTSLEDVRNEANVLRHLTTTVEASAHDEIHNFHINLTARKLTLRNPD